MPQLPQIDRAAPQRQAQTGSYAPRDGVLDSPMPLAQRVEQFGAAALVVDSDGIVQALNNRAARILGHGSIGLSWDSVCEFLFPLGTGHSATLDDGTVVEKIEAEQTQSGERIILLLEQSQPAHMQSASTPGAVLAHQLRTPLSTAVLYVSRLACEKNLSSQHRQWLVRTQEQLSAAERMVDNLLMFAKQSAFATETLSLADVVNGARKSCEAQITEAAMQCRVDIAAEHLPVLGNRVALVSAISNLVTNACCHAAGSSLVISAHRNDSNRGEICVRDSGPGFNNGGNALHPQQPGSPKRSGLGMSVAQHVIEQHGGSLTAANHSDGGALVRVELPLARCAADSVEVSI